MLDDETKEKNKMMLALKGEINALKKEMLSCEEEVTVAVKEKSNLQEDNRILLKTIDALNLLGFQNGSAAKAKEQDNHTDDAEINREARKK